MYSTYDDLLIEFSEAELAKLTGDPTGMSIDYDRVDYARTSADTTIDSYLWGVYDVPFDAEPIYPLIRKMSVDLTIAYLYEIAYKNTTLPSQVLWRKLNAIRTLKDMRDGNITIMDLERVKSPPPKVIAKKSDGDRIFSSNLLNKFFKK